MDKITKIFNFEVKQIGAEVERTLEFTGSTETQDHDGDVLESDGWNLSVYNKNPVVMGFHEYDKFPYANSQKTYVDPKRKALIFEVRFPTIEELTSYPNNPEMIAEHAKNVDLAYNMYKNSYMRAVSVGFIGNESEPIQEEGRYMGRRYKKQTLLELSLVPVPANFECLATARAKGILTDDDLKIFEQKELSQLQNKKVIPYKKYPLADEGEAWDGPAEVAAAEVDDLKQICAWYDEENAEDKGAYKLPHHKASDKNTVWRAVMAAMGALMGARGGVDIPEDDRKGVFEHLAKHYADFEKEPPEFKAYTEVELKEMFPEEVKTVNPTIKTPDTEGNPSTYDIEREIQNLVNPNYIIPGVWVVDLYPINYPSGKVVIARQSKYLLYNYTYEKVNDVVKITLDEGVEVEVAYSEKALNKRMEQKSGAQLSAKNRKKLESIHDGIDKCRQDMKEFLDEAMPMMEPMMTANMTVDMPPGPMGPDGMPMMSATRTADNLTVKVEMSDEFKQALDEIKSQVSLLLQKNETDAPKGKTDLDAIEKDSRVIRFKDSPAVKDADDNKPKVKLDENLVNQLMESFEKKLDQKIKGGI